MATYRYKIYKGRKLVAEGTNRREAEQEARRIGGRVVDTQQKMPSNRGHLPKPGQPSRWKRSYNYVHPGSRNPSHEVPYDVVEAVELCEDWADTYGTPVYTVATEDITTLDPDTVVEAAEQLEYYAEQVEEDPESYEPGEQFRLQGAAWTLHRYADTLAQAGKQSNPAPQGNATTDYAQGFADGLSAVAQAAPYFNKVANPAPQGSPDYMAGYVAAVGLFGHYAIGKHSLAVATVNAMGGGDIPPIRVTRPRPTGGGSPRPRPTGGGSTQPRPAPTTSGLSHLEGLILNALPADGTLMGRKDILEAWQASGANPWAGISFDGLTPKQVAAKKANAFSAATRSLAASGQIEKTGKGRWTRYRKATGAVAPKPTTPKPTTPKPTTPKPTTPKPTPEPEVEAGLVFSQPKWEKTHAALLAFGMDDAAIAKVRTEAMDKVAQGIKPIVLVFQIGDNVIAKVATGTPELELTVEIAEGTLPPDMKPALPAGLDNYAFEVTAENNPYFGRGRAKFWGGWG